MHFSLALAQLPHTSSESSPASVSLALHFTPIHHSCHCFSDYSLFCCQFQKMCFITAIFIYKGSLKLLDLAFKVVQKCGPTTSKLFQLFSSFFQMWIPQMSNSVCSFLIPHWLRLFLCYSCLPLHLNKVNKTTQSVNLSFIRYFRHLTLCWPFLDTSLTCTGETQAYMEPGGSWLWNHKQLDHSSLEFRALKSSIPYTIISSSLTY